jgi:hypothetical protein
MKQIPVLMKWLVLAAITDWSVGRTLTRIAIYMPKSPPILLIYQGLGWLGQFAAVFSGLLALGALCWIARNDFRQKREAVIWVSCSILFLLSLLNLVMAPLGWLALSYHFFMLVLLLALTRRAWQMGSCFTGKVASLLAGVTLVVSQLYQMIPAINMVAHVPTSPAWAVTLFNAGELLVVMCVILIWFVHGQQASWKAWLGGALPAAIFITIRLANPAMTGILAIWSAGLSLYLPWPVYALALWLASVTVITAVQRGNTAGWALLLLAAGGYAPQLNIQAYFGIVALWLLVSDEPGQVERFGAVISKEPVFFEVIRL